MKEHAEQAIDNLRDFLNGHSDHAKEQRQLLLLLDSTDDRHSSSDKFDHHLYLTRAIEFDVLTADDESFIYVKYLKFLQLCPIKVTSNAGWRTGRIHHHHGCLELKSHVLSGHIGNKIRESAKKLTKSRADISDKQADIIEKRVNDNMDKVIDAFK